MSYARRGRDERPAALGSVPLPPPARTAACPARTDLHPTLLCHLVTTGTPFATGRTMIALGSAKARDTTVTRK